MTRKKTDIDLYEDWAEEERAKMGVRMTEVTYTFDGGGDDERGGGSSGADEVVTLLAKAEGLTTDAYFVKYYGSKAKHDDIKRKEEKEAVAEQANSLEMEEHPGGPVRLALAREIADKMGVSYEALDEQIEREGG